MICSWTSVNFNVPGCWPGWRGIHQPNRVKIMADDTQFRKNVTLTTFRRDKLNLPLVFQLNGMVFVNAVEIEACLLLQWIKREISASNNFKAIEDAVCLRGKDPE